MTATTTSSGARTPTTSSAALGSDRITGFTGGDDVDGGEGNDVMTWNNGDGNDTNDGEDGVDETQINGRNTTDDVTVQNVAGGRVRFDRIAPGPFNVSMATVERLTVNTQAGDDKVVTGPGVTLPMTVDAGPGTDAITTGDAGDIVQGGEGVDTLNAGAGGDRLLGNPGNDVMNAGAGDDTLAWNNGDGTDDMNGEDGLDRIENNLGAADDVSQVKVLNGKVRYDRVNAPFGLNIATSEVFELNTFGGNDTLDVQPGVGALIAIVADAGSGNDRFNGGDENDTFFGGLGDDTLEPGAGFDSVDGQDGNDRLLVRDNTGDLARGGTGTDSAGRRRGGRARRDRERRRHPGRRHQGHRPARHQQAHQLEDQARHLHGARPRRVPGRRDRRLQGHAVAADREVPAHPRRQGAVRTARLQALHAPPRPAPDAEHEAPAGHRQVRRP